MTEFWGSPSPTVDERKHLELDLGLRAAYMQFKRIVLPKLESLNSIRAMSYALAGLYYKKSLGIKKSNTDVAHAIEALANKIKWEFYSSQGIHGIRGFQRDVDITVWNMNGLLRDYPRANSLRQRATGAAMQFGLVSGSRYSTMILTDKGERYFELFKDALGNNISKLEDYLTKSNENTLKSKKKRENLVCMTVDNPSEAEEKEMRSLVCLEPRLKALYDLITKHEKLETSYTKLSCIQHKNDINTLIAFNNFRASLQRLYVWIADESHIGNIKIDEVVKTDEAGKRVKDVKKKIRILQDAQKHSQLMSNNIIDHIYSIFEGDSSDWHRKFIDLDNTLIKIDSNGCIAKRVLYKQLDEEKYPDKNTPVELKQVQDLFDFTRTI
jgi:hypothetical protein